MSWGSFSSVSSFDDEEISSFGKIKLRPEVFENRGTISEKIGKAVAWVFSNLCELISSGCELLSDWVFSPMMEHALRPLLNRINNLFSSIFTNLADIATPFFDTVSEAFESIGTIFARIRAPLRDWVIDPIMERALTPMYHAISGLFTSMRPMLAEFTINLVDRVIRPITEDVLTPIYNVIAELFNAMKTAFADLRNELNSRIFVPIYDNVLAPALATIKPHAEASLEILKDWVFKPLWNSLSDCFNGIHTAAFVEECSLEELLTNIDITERDFISSDKDLKAYIAAVLENSHSNETSFKRINSLMALYLAKKHSVVIERDWLREDMISPELQSQYKQKANVRDLPEEV